MQVQKSLMQFAQSITLQGRIQSAIKSVLTKGDATTKRYASAPRVTWGSTAARRCAIRSAWTGATAPRQAYAPAPRGTKDGIVKAVCYTIFASYPYLQWTLGQLEEKLLKLNY